MKLLGMSVVICFTCLPVSNTNVLAAANQAEASMPLAPGYGELGYDLAEVGSYQLPPLGIAPNAAVLDESGEQVNLHNLYQDKYTLLSFIYSNCSDINGCPLASYVFYKLKSKMRNDKELADNLRLASLSFDPERDTPEVMRLYGANFKFAGNKGDWKFLTTPSETHLEPILKSYNQDIQREMSVNRDQTEDISHILRVFLIDPKLQIRNIYSVGFLHADLIINDFKTLLIHDQQSSLKVAGDDDKNGLPILAVPGDAKDGYEEGSYTTNSRAVVNRNGEETDLLALVNNPPLGLPKVPRSDTNPLTKEKIALGRKLFFDRRLSLNDTFSCAMCHVPEQGFTSNELSMAVGIEGRSVRRNSPTIYNVAYFDKLFHDGRENSLEQQIWGPLLAKNEMANPSVGYVIDKIKNIPGYKGLFEKAFNGEKVNMQNLSEAFASYQRTLISADSPFDRWHFGKQEDAISDSAKKGYQLFVGKARCVSCHHINEDHALFTDNKLHNTGIGYNESMGIKPEKERVILAPGVFVEVDTEIIDAVGEKTPADTGLYEVTQNPHDRWKYKTPSLRNISLTAPYMHNGSMRSLGDVVKFYNKGGVENELQDPLIEPLNLTASEEQDLVAFLQSLTGNNVDTLVSDAFAAPIGDLTQQDPNWAHQRVQSNE